MFTRKHRGRELYPQDVRIHGSAPPLSAQLALTVALTLVVAIPLAGCGSSTSGPASTTQPSTTQTTATEPSGTLRPAVDELAAAQRPQAGQFPTPHGRTLRQLAAQVRSAARLGAATGSFTPGQRRYAFALNTSSGAFIYAPTALYIARSPDAPAAGPFLAPADPLTVPPK